MVGHPERSPKLTLIGRSPWASRRSLDKTKTTGHIESVAKPGLKNKLLEAAVETLHRQGYHGCSIGDIAHAAGAPKGSVYNHFSSKEDLAIAALEHYRLQDQAAFAILEDTTIPAKERLRRHFVELSS